jgi:hypothetical protein
MTRVVRLSFTRTAAAPSAICPLLRARTGAAVVPLAAPALFAALRVARRALRGATDTQAEVVGDVAGADARDIVANDAREIVGDDAREIVGEDARGGFDEDAAEVLGEAAREVVDLSPVECLVYELLDAHADTVRLACELEDDLTWGAHTDYLRALQRQGRAMLSQHVLRKAA